MDDDSNNQTKELLPPQKQLELYRQALVLLFVYTLVVVGIIGLLLSLIEFFYGRVPILPLVALAGALGALFSALTRLYSLRQLPAALLLVGNADRKNNYLKVFCLVPPTVGMIGALFFYVLIASGIISSELFQDFHCNILKGCEGLGGLLSYSPITPTDYAKAIVWGFVAGFSERLVPDALARLEKTELK
ncbi:MAG: hypothetical protein Q8K18_15095 [Burkholderiales bacterium]|nr:hypothetical protein [Burkholderiales bacterium]